MDPETAGRRLPKSRRAWQRWRRAADRAVPAARRAPAKGRKRAWVLGLVLPLGLAAGIGVVDALLGPGVVLTGLLIAPPLVAGMNADARQTVVVLVVSLALALLLGMPNDVFAETDQLLRLLAIATVGALAVGFARLHEQRDATAARLSGLVDAALDCVISIDHEGRILEFNPAAERTFGYSREDALGRMMVDLIIPPALRKPHRAGVARYLASGEARVLGKQRVELTAMRADGSEFPVELAITRLGTDDPPRFTGFLRDITDRQRAEREVRETGERFRLAFDDAPIGMALTKPDGRFVRVNRALCQITGRSADDLLAGGFQAITHPDDVRADLDAIRAMLAGELESYQAEKRYIHADGHLVWVLLSASLLRDEDGEPLYFLGQVQDITRRKALEERLAHQALHDELTGLPNRVLLMDHVGLALRRSGRSGVRTTLFFVDLDRFKSVNDSLGHAAGDELLTGVAARIRDVMRPGDTVARLGGDEFAVLCEDVRLEHEALAISERLRRAIEPPFEIGGHEVSVTASIGVALAGRRDDTPDSLLSQADAAMYRAKERGRGREEVFEERMRPRMAERLELETDLRHALDRGQLSVLYQPQVDVGTGSVVGAEALVRWEHPSRGLLTPGEFVPLAEEIGMIAPIGEFVLDQACRQLARWTAERPDSRPLAVSVNLSALQLAEPGLSERIAGVLDTTAIDRGTLCLEITESTLMSTAGSTLTLLFALNGMGVRLAIDDFGTGYSSLGYLRRFPVQSLKIDRSFIEGVGRVADDSAIVAAIVSMGHSLGLSVVAEGVESQEQVAELRKLGCDLAQGFYFAPPQPAPLVDELLNQDWRPEAEGREEARVKRAPAQAA